MFNAGFYPTPEHVARRMVIGMDLHDKYILDPGGGKGDLLDVIYNRVGNQDRLYTCEVQPELRAILADKGYSILADDFLTYSPTIQFDYIIGNPPFGDAEDHLIHAWNIVPEGGEVVFLMPCKALEEKDTKEQLVARLIADYGTPPERLGQPFRQAERTTNAEVAIVRLKKPVATTGKFGFEVRNDFAEPELDTSETRAFAPTGFIASLIAYYTAAINAYAEYEAARRKIESFLSPFVDNHDRKRLLEKADDQETPRDKFNAFYAGATSKAWGKILDHPKFQMQLTDRARKMINDFRQRQRRVDFTEANIRAMFGELLANSDKFLQAAIDDAFENMTRYHKDNRIHIEGWKSNEAHLVSRKVVMPYFVEQWGDTGTWHWNWSWTDKLDDIDRAMCVIVKRPFETVTTIRAAVDMAWQARTGSNYAESTFFQVRWFKKGTLHIRFKDVDLWKQFNLTAARGRNWLPDSGEYDSIFAQHSK